MFENVYHIILSVTRDCNLQCAYCFEGDKSRYSGERMSFDVFKKFIDRFVIDQNKRLDGPLPRIELCFHGGEPTLIGVHEATRFVEYALSKIPQTNIHMQTNATLINTEWIYFFQRYGVRPGMSLDGLDFNQNKLRAKKKCLLDALRIFVRAHVQFGVIVVITRNNLKRILRIITELKKKYKVNSVRANPAVIVAHIKQNPLIEVAGGDLFKYVFIPTMSLFFKCFSIAEFNIMQIVARYINYVVQGNVFQEGLCDLKFCGGGNHMVNVLPNGVVAYCQRWPYEHTIKDVGDFLNPRSDLFGLRSLNVVRKLYLKRIEDANFRKCDVCPAWYFCNYGCMGFAYSKYHGQLMMDNDATCCYFLSILDYFSRHGARVVFAYGVYCGYQIVEDDEAFYVNYPPNKHMSVIPITGVSWALFAGNPYVRIEKNKIGSTCYFYKWYQFRLIFEKIIKKGKK